MYVWHKWREITTKQTETPQSKTQPNKYFISAIKICHQLNNHIWAYKITSSQQKNECKFYPSYFCLNVKRVSFLYLITE